MLTVPFNVYDCTGISPIRTDDLMQDYINFITSLESEVVAYSGGSGSEADPHQIATKQDLLDLGANTDDYGRYFKLSADIDLAGEIFSRSPIGGDTYSDSDFGGTLFSGTFDGNGYVIRNLTVTEENYCGLFGKTSSGAVIKNLGVEYTNITVLDYCYAASLVGYNNGSITNCYSTGTVTGVEYGWALGGLVGYNNGSIVNCYSIGTVTGDGGGLVGFNNSGSISNCYSAGVVTGYYDFGGLVGGNNSGSISNCYFYMYSGPDNGYGTALEDTQLQDKGSFAGFDFTGDTSDGTDDNWTIEPGYMPRLTWQDGPGFEAPYRLDSIITTLGGTGYVNDPFIIASYNDLMEFRTNSALRIGHYSLVSDINLAEATYTEAFITEDFSGNFAGNGYTISNLTIDSDGYYLSFFNSLHGFVNDLALKDVSITGSGDGACLVGDNYGHIDNCYSTGTVTGVEYGWVAGGLVTFNQGSISNCYSTVTVDSYFFAAGLVCVNWGDVNNCYSKGTITGTDEYAGGLVGYNSGGSIVNCYSTGTVTSDRGVGGLVGGQDDGDVNNCYSTGVVNGYELVGGLVGHNSGSIGNCYSTGTVTGNSYAGGLLGFNYEGDVNNCYSTGAVDGYELAGGLVGNNLGTFTNCYSTGAVSGDSNIGGLCGRDSYLGYTGVLNNCFWDIETSGITTSYGGASKTTAEMKMLSTFDSVGWDFSDIDGDAADWKMLRQSEDYPRLYWQIEYAGDVAGLYGVNLIDFSLFAASWMSELGDGNWNPICNLDNDGDSIDLIDAADLLVLCENWLEGVGP